MTTVPRPNPDFVPPTTFTAVDYYVLSRCDGRASIKEILLMLSGVGDGVEILRKLRRAGALLIEGEDARPAQESAPEPVASSAPILPAQPQIEKSGPIKRPATEVPDDEPLLDLGELSDEEGLAMASANVELPERTKREIIVARRYLGNYFALLGVDPDVGKRQLKRAYFRFSKRFHPDRFYKKDLGLFGPWLAEIFETATKAFNILSDSRQRKQYEARLFGKKAGPGTQTREEHAAELFERACDTEIRGDLDQALQLFAAAIRSHPKAAYISRAGRCALRAKKLDVAEEYAKKAAGLRPKDPSYARLLADVYRAAGRLDDAEATLLHAIELNQENDVLMAELSEDLEKVRGARP